MKAETKAKRRATLSICGLGLLDESEVETIPGAHAVPSPAPEAGEPSPPARPHHSRRVNVIENPATGRKIDTENAKNQRPEWERFTDKVKGFVEAFDTDGLKKWYTSEEVAAFVAGWVFKDEAEEHFNAAVDRIKELERG